jgi:hypothetical protein
LKRWGKTLVSETYRTVVRVRTDIHLPESFRFKDCIARVSSDGSGIVYAQSDIFFYSTPDVFCATFSTLMHQSATTYILKHMDRAQRAEYDAVLRHHHNLRPLCLSQEMFSPKPRLYELRPSFQVILKFRAHGEPVEDNFDIESHVGHLPTWSNWTMFLDHSGKQMRKRVGRTSTIYVKDMLMPPESTIPTEDTAATAAFRSAVMVPHEVAAALSGVAQPERRLFPGRDAGAAHERSRERQIQRSGIFLYCGCHFVIGNGVEAYWRRSQVRKRSEKFTLHLVEPMVLRILNRSP